MKERPPVRGNVCVRVEALTPSARDIGGGGRGREWFRGVGGDLRRRRLPEVRADRAAGGEERGQDAGEADSVRFVGWSHGRQLGITARCYRHRLMPWAPR